MKNTDAVDRMESGALAAKGQDHSTPRPSAVVVTEAHVPAVTPMAMLQLAVEKGASVEQLERLMALQERYEANEAKKEFVAAMTRFKEHPKVIEKNAQVDFSSAKGRTHYRHATLANVCDVIGPALSEVGISHRWETEQLADGGMIRVTCILTHARGHSERVWLQAARDDSGNKNSIQAVGSTVTYLQRYTLLAATGMAVADQRDDDGKGGGPRQLDEGVKVDYQSAIEALVDKKSAEVLWSEIASVCTKSGDVQAYDELKKMMSAKIKSLAPK